VKKRLKCFVFLSFTVAPILLCHALAHSALPSTEGAQTAVLVGAGDIADCKDLSGAEATAKLLEKIPGTVIAVGDLAYPDGSKENFECYDRTWGRVKSRTRPSPGNHEFHAAGATPYFDYFGVAAGDPKAGYYSYELGAWHVIVLNSECKDVGGCDAGSPQEKWLRADLTAHPVACTLAYWHKPLFSSGGAHGNDLTVKPLWQALYEANADVIIGGHDHDYERFGRRRRLARPIPLAGFVNLSLAPGEKAIGRSAKPSRTAKCAMPPPSVCSS
jgi:hypothetical protein